MVVIAVTGILGAGKTTIANMLKEKGAALIEPDKIGWKVLEQKKDKIITSFGNEAITKGKVDRKKLGQIVFNNKKQLEKLNKITHTEIIKQIKDEIKKKKQKIIIIDAALYDKLKLGEITHKKILVKTTTEKICERLLNKYKKQQILDIIKIQKQSERADHTIDNNFSLEYTQKQVNILWQILNRK